MLRFLPILPWRWRSTKSSGRGSCRSCKPFPEVRSIDIGRWRHHAQPDERRETAFFFQIRNVPGPSICLCSSTSRGSSRNQTRRTSTSTSPRRGECRCSRRWPKRAYVPCIPHKSALSNLENCVRACRACCVLQVRAVFAGHYHRNSYGTLGKMEMITTSAVGRPLGVDPSGFRVH